MKKIYTLIQKKTIVFCLSLALLSTTAFGQICGAVIEDFRNTGGSTAGFTGDFTYDAAGERLIKNNVIATAVYVVTTPTYQLPSNASSLGFGFTLSGTERVSRVEVVAVYVSTLTNQITSIFLTQFVPNYGASSSSIVCQAVSLSSLPGFPTNGKYRFRLEFTTNTGVGQAAQTITFDDFSTNGTLAQAPLPVNFIGFDGKKVSGGNQISWKVAGEENVDRYELERSTDGRTFTTIGSFPTTKKDTYTYLDAGNNPVAYYRVRNVDNNGSYKYTSVIRMVNGKSEIIIKAFPQPVVSQLTVQHPTIKDNSLINITTADGKLVKSVRPSAGSMQTFIDVATLQKGLYLVRFADESGNVETIKVLKQ